MAVEWWDRQNAQTVELEKVWLQVSQVIADYPGLRDNIKLREHLDQVVRQMALQLYGWCVSGRIPDVLEHHVFSVPDGVWQMLKDRHMPKWFVKRWPVRYTEYRFISNVNHYFVCPHLVTDAKEQHVKFMVTGTRNASRF